MGLTRILLDGRWCALADLGSRAGDDKLLYGQGRPMAKDATGGGLDFAEGLTSTEGAVTVESRLFFDGTVASSGSVNDLSRLTDAREKGRIGILGSALSYAGSYARVTSESIGRDLNPLGRGDGSAYVAGGLNLGRISPALPWNNSPGGWGNSVNNGCGDGSGNGLDGPSGLGGGGSTVKSDPAECEAAGIPSCCCCEWPCRNPVETENFVGPLQRNCSCPTECSRSGVHCTGELEPNWTNHCEGQLGTGGAGGGTGGGCPGCGGSGRTGTGGPGVNGGCGLAESPPGYVHIGEIVLVSIMPLWDDIPEDPDAPINIHGYHNWLRLCHMVKNKAYNLALMAAIGCCNLNREAKQQGRAGIRGFDPCCVDGFWNCILNTKVGIGCASRYFFGLTRGDLYLPSFQEKYGLCAINILIESGRSLYDYAKAILHELSHCCGTNDLGGESEQEGSSNGFGDWFDIDAHDVDDCVDLLKSQWSGKLLDLIL